MPILELTDSEKKGIGESIRLALQIGHIPFLDKRVRLSLQDLADNRGNTSKVFQEYPVLRVDEVISSQPLALLRYAGKLANLYPVKDDLLALKVDEFMCVINTAISELKQTKGQTARDLLAANIASHFMNAIDGAVQSNNNISLEWVCGPQMTIADLMLYVWLNMIKHGYFDYVPASICDNYPRLVTTFNAVASHPTVTAWNKKHPWNCIS